MGYELGVDLGTTYTAAATHRGGATRIVELGNRSATIPSVIYLTEDDEILTGEAANRRAATNPGRVAREFKRRIGDPTPVILGGSPYSAESLSARLLEWVIARVTEREGAAPDRVAVTHPANWGPYKLDLLHQAVRMANLEQVHTLTEPEAAAIHYSTLERIDPGMTVAVFDLGGGTFDAAILRKKAHGFDVLGEPEGIERLGGIDFDAAVFAFVRNALGDAMDQLDPADPSVVSAVGRLRRDCVDAKEALSSDTEVTIPVVLPGLHTDIRLTRMEFEGMIRPSLADSISSLERAVRGASLEMSEIDLILLVGGSSRIPLVGQMVGGELGRPVAVDAHPKHSVAQGAAWAASNAGGAHLSQVTGVIEIPEDVRDAAPPSVGSGTVIAPAGQPPSAPAEPAAPSPAPSAPAAAAAGAAAAAAGAAAAAATGPTEVAASAAPAAATGPTETAPSAAPAAATGPTETAASAAPAAATGPTEAAPSAAPPAPGATEAAPGAPSAPSPADMPPPTATMAAPAAPPAEQAPAAPTAAPAPAAPPAPTPSPTEQPAAFNAPPPAAPAAPAGTESSAAAAATGAAGGAALAGAAAAASTAAPDTSAAGEVVRSQPFSGRPTTTESTNGGDSAEAAGGAEAATSAAAFTAAGAGSGPNLGLLIGIGAVVGVVILGILGVTQLGGGGDTPIETAGAEGEEGEGPDGTVGAGEDGGEAGQDGDGATGTTAPDATTNTTEATTTTPTTARTTTSTTQPTTTVFTCAGLCTHIKTVEIQPNGELIVDWDPFNFGGDPSVNNFHAHFFYDIYRPTQVGSNNAQFNDTPRGSWALTANTPFSTDGSNVDITGAPAGTERLCVVAADSGHGVVNPENAECIDLETGEVGPYDG